jgi:hypothetical protein
MSNEPSALLPESRYGRIGHSRRKGDAATLAQIAKDGGFAFIAIINDRDEVLVSAAGTQTVDASTIRSSIRPSADDAGDDRFNVFTSPVKDGRRLVLAADKADRGTVGQLIDSSLDEYGSLKQQQNTIRQLGLLILGVLTFL